MAVSLSVGMGSRCVCEGYHGTVRYVGELPSTTGNVYELNSTTAMTILNSTLKGSGLEWSGTTLRGGSIAGVMKVSSTSHAGKRTSQGRWEHGGAYTIIFLQSQF